ncbi:DUF192 domain-containing protein [Brevundimonas sp. A19_0]|uniref:DUF192 domain-containing protein n=1 Tax=Brevundimonas sp. A19_0 TaxID=2821087 RepID=UPI001ADAE665|nr:DUF192 domain-containing protein [Brevundimonas sp. A19_0]MBO9500582.1 DUF192 domain-containing protein [Brevundimonas sp. A19_0]
MSLARGYAVVALVATLLVTGACGAQDARTPGGQSLPIEPLTVVTAQGSFDFDVEIADEEPERQRGMMYRPPLADDRGMLFQYPEAAERGFWMLNTPSSLDIVYLDPQGCIISIAAHTTPYTESTYPSRGAANGVLEVRAGRMGEIGAQPGDRVRHPFFDTDAPCDH